MRVLLRLFTCNGHGIALGLGAAALAGLLSACGRGDEVREYTEILGHEPHPVHTHAAPGAQSPAAPMMPEQSAPAPSAPRESSAPDGTLAWTMPEGWEAKPADGMRLGSFATPSGGDCSIVILGGAAGGQSANIRRWIGQIGIEIGEDEFEQFINGAEGLETVGGLSGKFYNFTTLSEDDNAPSMLAAIFDIGGQSVFVKLSAPRRVAVDEIPAFKALCLSLRPGA